MEEGVSVMGNSLGDIRRSKGMSQERLEQLSGIERSKLSRIETGERKISGTEVLYLAAALEVTPEAILGTQSTGLVRFQGGVAGLPDQARRTAEWFEHFVDDALFVERAARRYGVE